MSAHASPALTRGSCVAALRRDPLGKGRLEAIVDAEQCGGIVPPRHPTVDWAIMHAVTAQTGKAMYSCLQLTAGTVATMTPQQHQAVREALRRADGEREAAQAARIASARIEGAYEAPPCFTYKGGAEGGNGGRTRVVLRTRGGGDVAVAGGGGGGGDDDGEHSRRPPVPVIYLVEHRFEPWEATPDAEALRQLTVGQLANMAMQLYAEGRHDTPNMFTKAGNLRALNTANGVYARARKFIERETEADRVRARRRQVARAQDIVAIMVEVHGLPATIQQLVYILTDEAVVGEAQADADGGGPQVNGTGAREAGVAGTYTRAGGGVGGACCTSTHARTPAPRTRRSRDHRLRPSESTHAHNTMRTKGG